MASYDGIPTRRMSFRSNGSQTRSDEMNSLIEQDIEDHELKPLGPQNHRSLADSTRRRAQRPSISSISISEFPWVDTTETGKFSPADQEEDNVKGRAAAADLGAQNTQFEEQESIASRPQSSPTMYDVEVEPDPAQEDSRTLSHERPLKQAKSSPIHRLWLWEISASIVSLICIASIVTVLILVQGRRLDQWGLGQSYLAPNVIVSFLGTMARSSCLLAITQIVSQLKWTHFEKRPQTLSDIQLFDDASRGPFGAAQLALLKNRRTVLATCASIITIASLLVEPFIQSVFQFPIKLAPVAGAFPGIASSQIYDPSSLSYVDNQCFGSGWTGWTAASMKAAVLSPIWNITLAPSLTCNYETCEWPTITTLGVCSKCIDLTDTVTSTCAPNEDSYKALECNYTIPSTESTFNAVFGLTETVAGLAYYSTLWSSTGADTYLNPLNQAVGLYSSNFSQSEPALLSNFAFVSLNITSFADYLISNATAIISWTDPPIKKAMQCGFQLCGRTFDRPSYTNFTASLPDGPQILLSTAEKGTTVSDSAKALIGLAPESQFDTTMNTTFQINYCEYQYIGEYLADIFTAEMSSNGAMGTASDAAASPNDMTAHLTPNVGFVLSREDDIPGLMSRIADSITENMRTSANATITSGTAMESVAFIEIRWAWLALPVSVVCLTLVLLILVIAQSHTRRVPAWRSSALSLLFYDLEGWDKTKITPGGPAELDALAKDMKAQIVNEPGHLLFSKA